MTLIEARHITLSMGTKILCSELNFQANSGETWGILGPNGSGKTTFLHALAGLHPLKNGEIFLLGAPISTLKNKMIARDLALLFQDFNANFPQTVWDFCRAARFPHPPYFMKESHVDQQVIDDALQVMHLKSHKNHLISDLSGGEKRRLAIAAVLAQTPKIYLLDEPTNHLDIRHQHLTLTHFRTLSTTKNTACIMALHDINLAKKYCDHILLFFDDGTFIQGKTLAMLTPENLSRAYRYSVQLINKEFFDYG